MKKIQKPQALKPGDLVRVVAASSPFDKDAFFEGVRILESWGLVVKYQKNIFERTPYLAGSDGRRFAELKEALADKQTKAIFFARGGYGAMRLLDKLSKIKLPTTPKIILGYSDLTALHLFFMNKAGWTTFYGPVVAKDIGPKSEKLTLTSLKAAITSTEPLGEINLAGAQILKRGTASGKIIGGCLSLIAALMGTPYEIDSDGKILFLEDINEKPYAVDRMLTQLEIAGKFKKCRGLIVGSMAGPNPLKHYAEAILSVLGDKKFPIVMNVSAGHSPKKLTLPLNVLVKLDTNNKTLTYLESAAK